VRHEDRTSSVSNRDLHGTEAAQWAPLLWKSLEEAVRASQNVLEGEPGVQYRGACSHTMFLAAARYLHDNGGRLLTLAASQHEEGEIHLTYTFEIGATAHIVIRSVTDRRSMDSLFSLFACADFLEREVNNLFGIKFLGHPNLSNVESA